MTGIYRGVKSTQVFDSLDAARSAIPASAAASIEVWEFGQTIEFVRDPDGADLTMYDGSRWRREATPEEAVAIANSASLAALDAQEAVADLPWRKTDTIAGNAPFLNVSKSTTVPPKNHFFVQQDTTERNDSVTVQIQRLVETHDGLANPKALRVLTRVAVDTAQTEWAISAELDSHSNTASTGNTALSGVSNKYGTASVFAGHLQAKDWTIAASATEVTALLGCEINTPAVGLDHPAANNRLGLRRAFDIIARTNQQAAGWNTAPGNSGDAEIGAGAVIRNDNLTKGYFRYGLVIDDVSQAGNPNPIGTAVLVRTSGTDGVVVRGKNAGAAVRVDPMTPGAFGFRVNGAYTIGAIGVDSGQWITLFTDGTRKFRYSAGPDAFEVWNGATLRASFRVNASPALLLNGTQVVGQRQAAIPDAAAGTEVSTINAMLAAMRAHGLIAT